MPNILSRAQRIVELSERVTRGKWKTWGMSVMAPNDGVDTDNSDLSLSHEVAMTAMTINGHPRTFDAEFIAASRNDGPAIAQALVDAESLLRAIKEDIMWGDPDKACSMVQRRVSYFLAMLGGDGDA